MRELPMNFPLSGIQHVNGCRVAAQVRSGLSWHISSNFTVRTFCQASGLTGGTHLPLSLLLTLPVSLLVPLLISPYMFLYTSYQAAM